jgi:hypothetical protein
VRVALNDIIAELNPALPPDERETLALFISASMEEKTVLAIQRHAANSCDSSPEWPILACARNRASAALREARSCAYPQPDSKVLALTKATNERSAGLKGVSTYLNSRS